jgi:hypothetical protein
MSNQLDLFSSMIDRDGEEPEFKVKEHVRTTDPDTSRAAAESVAGSVTLVQKRVVEIHSEHPEGMTDEELTDAYIGLYGPAGQSSVRSRRHDLAVKGRFIETTLRRKLRSGRSGIVWQLSRSVDE